MINEKDFLPINIYSYMKKFTQWLEENEQNEGYFGDLATKAKKAIKPALLALSLGAAGLTGAGNVHAQDWEKIGPVNVQAALNLDKSKLKSFIEKLQGYEDSAPKYFLNFFSGKKVDGKAAGLDDYTLYVIGFPTSSAAGKSSLIRGRKMSAIHLFKSQPVGQVDSKNFVIFAFPN